MRKEFPIENLKVLARKFFTYPAKAAAFCIRVYQKTVSFDHGLLSSLYPYGFCRHYPSCSEYSRISLLRHGLLKGLLLSLARVVRCHPWAQPSIDQVPHVFPFRIKRIL